MLIGKLCSRATTYLNFSSFGPLIKWDIFNYLRSLFLYCLFSFIITFSSFTLALAGRLRRAFRAHIQSVWRNTAISDVQVQYLRKLWQIRNFSHRRLEVGREGEATLII
ncbi:hypothetical protein BCR32DRAFT_285821 [Anaeromyces robustus]|uniref:Uncharacterized protein n=1 Tax=Anaeromyces robustus TaxID=1754192 RepID=A0A1Y1WEA0_9FUNG|nr:hypothetical protein BCR32DRAFT_285821 [Anaeromyces robustus]|eukprot:ORX71715.1 hypothetical protein BCR32DRAFT_285821 [Anaeromyces robustus]